jgi:hypothetical protein
MTEEQKARGVIRRITAAERKLRTLDPSSAEWDRLSAEYRELLAHRDNEMHRLITEVLTGLQALGTEHKPRQLEMFGAASTGTPEASHG